jgi:hypothetical protein
MRIKGLFSRKNPTAVDEVDASCSGTLVLHADGTIECEHEAECDCDELLHELWVTCDELRCGCVGEEAPLLLAA